jgi:hypothetical protein
MSTVAMRTNWTLGTLVQPTPTKPTRFMGCLPIIKRTPVISAGFRTPRPRAWPTISNIRHNMGDLPCLNRAICPSSTIPLRRATPIVALHLLALRRLSSSNFNNTSHSNIKVGHLCLAPMRLHTYTACMPC